MSKTNAIEIFQKKKGKQVMVSFQVMVDADKAPSAVATIRRKMTAIDMAPQENHNSEIPIVRTSLIPMAG